MHCNLLDRDFHTPSLVCSRSPFLLTTSESTLSSEEHALNCLKFAPYRRGFIPLGQSFTASLQKYQTSWRLLYLPEGINLWRSSKPICCSRYGEQVLSSAMNRIKLGCFLVWRFGKSQKTFHLFFLKSDGIGDGIAWPPT